MMTHSTFVYDSLNNWMSPSKEHYFTLYSHNQGRTHIRSRQHFSYVNPSTIRVFPFSVLIRLIKKIMWDPIILALLHAITCSQSVTPRCSHYCAITDLLHLTRCSTHLWTREHKIATAFLLATMSWLMQKDLDNSPYGLPLLC